MTFRSLKNLGLGLLLIILLLVVAYAQLRSNRAAATLQQIISRDIPAQLQLAQIRELVSEAEFKLGCLPVGETLDPATEPDDGSSLREQIATLQALLGDVDDSTPGAAEVDALLLAVADVDTPSATEAAALLDAITGIETIANDDWPEAARTKLADVAAQARTAAEPGGADSGSTQVEASTKIGQAAARLSQLRDSIGRESELADAVAAISPAIRAAEHYRDAINTSLAQEEVRALSRTLDARLQDVEVRLSERLRASQFAALDESQADRRWFVWVALVSVGLAALISLVFSRALSTRIEAVVTATRRFSGGDLAWRLPVRGDDELGRLGSAFNEMAEGLRALVGNVHLAGIQVAGAATEIAATMKQQETSANEQAATASEIAASTREIASTSDALLSNVAQVSQVAQDVAGLGAESAAGLSRMETTMNQMADASRDIADKLAVLNEKAGTISSVVTTINKVADQTNLLSLNAAIEAEKAGEYGLGFGVVAKEIRRLADQTAVATWDIEQVVKEIQSAVSAGVMGMERFTEEVRQGVDEIATAGQQLSGIVGQVQTLAPHFETVHEGMQSQTQGAEQINQAIAQLSETVGSAAEAMQDGERVVVQLNEAAARLQQAVGNFKLRD